MKRTAVFFISLLLACLTAFGQVCEMEQPGSLLVYPLIDNINYRTIIEITNQAGAPVWLQGFMIVHPPGSPHQFDKLDFLIHLTQKEVFWWNTSLGYLRQDPDGVVTQIPGFNNKKGFMFVWAVNHPSHQLEISWNSLRGDALVFNAASRRAFQYHAIPHQARSVAGDRILNLDGIEYTMATSTVMIEGFAENTVGGLDGTWILCSLDIDFIRSIQPEFDINLTLWNQDEVPQSRHLDFYQFEQYDLKDDLQLDINQVFTPKWHLITAANDALWAVSYQTLGSMAWGGNAWLKPEAGAPATVILPPAPAVMKKP